MSLQEFTSLDKSISEWSSDKDKKVHISETHWGNMDTSRECPHSNLRHHPLYVEPQHPLFACPHCSRPLPLVVHLTVHLTLPTLVPIPPL